MPAPMQKKPCHGGRVSAWALIYVKGGNCDAYDVGYDPVDVLLCAPSGNEETRGDEEGPRHHRG